MTSFSQGTAPTGNVTAYCIRAQHRQNENAATSKFKLIINNYVKSELPGVQLCIPEHLSRAVHPVPSLGQVGKKSRLFVCTGQTLTCRREAVEVDVGLRRGIEAEGGVVEEAAEEPEDGETVEDTIDDPDGSAVEEAAEDTEGGANDDCEGTDEGPAVDDAVVENYQVVQGLTLHLVQR